MAKHIHSTAEFDGIVKSAKDQLVVIDFTASWCGPCKAIAPVFESLAKENSGKAHFVKVDVDEQAAIAQRYSVRAMPTFVFMRRGGVLDTLRGANANRLQQLTKQYMAGGSAAADSGAGGFPGSGQTIASGSSSAPAGGGGIFAQIPRENLFPFLVIFGYLGYILYKIYLK